MNKLNQPTIAIDGEDMPVNMALHTITEKWVDAGEYSGQTVIDLRNALAHYYGINCKRVIDHIEAICPKCGHETTEDGCAHCLKAQVEKKEKTISDYQSGLEKIARASGIETPLELVAMAENNEENYMDILSKHIRNTIAALEKNEPAIEINTAPMDPKITKKISASLEKGERV